VTVLECCISYSADHSPYNRFVTGNKRSLIRKH